MVGRGWDWGRVWGQGLEAGAGGRGRGWRQGQGYGLGAVSFVVSCNHEATTPG